MKCKCTLPSGLTTDELKRFHPKCELCGWKIPITGSVGSGELWRDSNGEIYLTFVEHNGATGLLAITTEGFLIASSNIAWPITRLPEGTVLTCIQSV